MWYQKLTSGLAGQHIVNDSKTPSGQIHVGSLRGVLIHDALYRTLLENNIAVKYLYGIDDYDPMDGLPADADESLQKHMGKPICHVPAPPLSRASDLADHYASDFLDIFKELGVDAKIYRTRDLYCKGKFNKAIQTILEHSATVRKIYREVSGSHKPDNWYPFQVICESCGKIGTTMVYDYSDGLVSYRCLPDMVSWAHGCGNRGVISPLNGSGKLPWKLEWVAKWATLGVTVEGAGKDHCTKGGSRDVAVRCLQQIFRKKAPVNIPYEFFLVNGAKMSSSKGIGTSAREIADFLPPTILRFLMIRTPPKRTVNFSTDSEYIVKLFNEYDQLIRKDSHGSKDVESMQKMVHTDNQIPCCQPVSFQLITALLQMPNKDIVGQITDRYNLTREQKKDLEMRIRSATYWLEYFADKNDRVTLQDQLPESAHQLGASQKALLFVLAHYLPDSSKKDEDFYQQLIFDVARLIPVASKLAFGALYRVLFDTSHGPKGGSLLAYIDQTFLRRRLTGMLPDIGQLLETTNIAGDQLISWLDKSNTNLVDIQATDILYKQEKIVQLLIELDDSRVHIMRTSAIQEVHIWLQNNGIPVTQNQPVTIKGWLEDWKYLTHTS